VKRFTSEEKILWDLGRTGKNGNYGKGQLGDMFP
jgi:hypothetical protein